MRKEVLFHEVYSVYFKAFSKLLEASLAGPLDALSAEGLVSKILYDNMSWKLVDAISKGEYAEIIDKNFLPKIKHRPEQPLTLLEKRWLKTIMLDKRFALFECQVPNLGDVEPLYKEEDVHFCGVASSGDPYESDNYRKTFRTILRALREEKFLNLIYQDSSKGIKFEKVEPIQLEYDMKADCFQLCSIYKCDFFYFNLAKIRVCELGENIIVRSNIIKPQYIRIEIELLNEKNDLEHFLLYFSTYKKSTAHLHGNVFKVEIWIPSRERNEVLDNLLSFIPRIKVKKPERIKIIFLERIKAQKHLLLDLEKDSLKNR